MSIIVNKKNPITHTVKVALMTLLIFIAVGLIARYGKEDVPGTADRTQTFSNLLNSKSSLLLPQVPLPVPRDAHEKEWIASLASTISGKSEVAVDFGRADVITENYAIEVDFIPKWKEGLGQALHYSSVTHLIPVLALIAKDQPDDKLLGQIEMLCTSKGVKVVLLVPQR